MRVIGTAWMAWALGAQVAAAQALLAPPPVGGRLAGSVLLGEAPLESRELSGDLSSSDRMRLQAYLDRWKAFKAPTTGTSGSTETQDRRARLEREIASAIERPGIEQVASNIAWSQGPYGVTADLQQEAGWAEGLLRDPANAVAAPFLYAFLASRYRMQLERAGEDRSALERLAKKYKTMLDRVRNAGDGLLVLLADDLDNRASLSPGATRHPRQYLPDT